MKLFILAALIAISSAARLEHLERGYLPPDQGGQGQFGGRGQGFNGGSNSIGSGSGFGSHGSGSGFGSHGSGSGFGSHGSGFGSHAGHGSDDSAGFGSAPQGSRVGAAGVRGVSSFEAAQSNQYLPPDHGPSGSSGNFRGQDAFGASSNQFGSQSQFGQSSGFGSQGSKGFGSQGSSGFGSQGSNGFGSQGSSGFGSQGSNGFGSQGSNGFNSQSNAFRSQGSSGFSTNSQRQQPSSLRQYLAPKTSSSFDKIPQQAFDEETGYHY